MDARYDFGFVILHYEAYEMTIEATEYIYNNFGLHSMIVIVDNASKNQSGPTIKSHFESIKNIKVIINDVNLGFSNGNNIGYTYLKNNFNVEFIVVLNNDVLIKQPNFCEVVKELYRKEKFAVLGPDIYNPVIKKHQNPHRLKLYNYNDINTRLKIFERICKYPLYFYLRHRTFGSIKRKVLNDSSHETFYMNELISQEMVLHGACYIFSKAFIDKREKCFNPCTFLYFEEDILAYECSRDHLMLMYSPEVKVEHLEDVSSKQAWGNGYYRFKRTNMEMMRSCKLLLNLMARG